VKPSIKNTVLMVLMLLSAGLTVALRPTDSLADQRPPIDLDTLIPTAFGDWRELENKSAQIINPQMAETLSMAYSQTLSRTYIDSHGYRIMLSLAYGKTQRGNLQLHHPELCYPGQGFEILSNKTSQLTTKFGVLPIRLLETQKSRSRYEPVTYWATIGEKVVLGSVQRKIVEIQYGLRGQMADGLLFRVSSIDPNTTSAFNQQTEFVAKLLDVLSPTDRHRIAGM
jgi:EpsI family protein